MINPTHLAPQCHITPHLPALSAPALLRLADLGIPLRPQPPQGIGAAPARAAPVDGRAGVLGEVSAALTHGVADLAVLAAFGGWEGDGPVGPAREGTVVDRGFGVAAAEAAVVPGAHGGIKGGGIELGDWDAEVATGGVRIPDCSSPFSYSEGKRGGVPE